MIFKKNKIFPRVTSPKSILIDMDKMYAELL
nr:MAG TPA: hypothetical protein [Caudoviricetes sp.]